MGSYMCSYKFPNMGLIIVALLINAVLTTPEPPSSNLCWNLLRYPAQSLGEPV